jgi:uracil-DNA glycosylase
MKRTRAS